MLRAMGARIAVYGQERIEIDGVDALGGVDHRVIPDNMEALTWLVGAAITGGEVEIHDFPLRDLEVPLVFLRESGVKLYVGDTSLLVRASACRPVEIATGPYPGINSDMQPLFAVFGAMSPGESRIVDLRFPGRYAYAGELARLGVDAQVVGDLLQVRGGRPLRGAEVTALDLRAGIALTLCGLVADGVTTVADAWQIERGYDRFTEKAVGLGAHLVTLRG
jgi:UDP-N-acetylglucosamine 1-carboxyvinyltransferase